MRQRPTSDKQLTGAVPRNPKIMHPFKVRPKHVRDDVRSHKGAPPSYIERSEAEELDQELVDRAERNKLRASGHHHQHSSSESPPGTASSSPRNVSPENKKKNLEQLEFRRTIRSTNSIFVDSKVSTEGWHSGAGGENEESE
jgi:hypothetical protein